MSRLGLRFDRVVHRVATDLRAHATRTVPDGVVVLATLTAPILQPAKTVTALQTLVDQLMASEAEPREVTAEIHGNGVRVRVRAAWPRFAAKFLLFVHNRDVDARCLLDDVCALESPPLA